MLELTGSLFEREIVSMEHPLQERVDCESGASVPFATPQRSMLRMVIIALPEVPGA